MPRRLLLDTVHVHFTVPDSLGSAPAARAARTLAGARFAARLGASLRGLLARHPSLGPVRVTIAR